jgi:hypothetical protein
MLQMKIKNPVKSTNSYFFNEFECVYDLISNAMVLKKIHNKMNKKNTSTNDESLK